MKDISGQKLRKVEINEKRQWKIILVSLVLMGTERLGTRLTTGDASQGT